MIRALACLGLLAIVGLSACGTQPLSTDDRTGTGGLGDVTPASGDGGAGVTVGPTCLDLQEIVPSCPPGVVWYAFGDSIGPSASANGDHFSNSDCAKAGFDAAQCSEVIAPVAGTAVTPDRTTGAICASGVAARVINGPDGTPAVAAIWGAGLAVDLNPAGSITGGKGTFDGSSYRGVSFDFTGSMIAVDQLRVNFVFAGQGPAGPPYYDGAAQPYSPVSNNTHVVVPWDDVGGPGPFTLAIDSPRPPPFDPSQLETIQFQVLTNVAASVPYQFCINNLALLTD